jgi:hypothetical protein
MCFFLAKLIDDQQSDTFNHRTLDPCVDARVGRALSYESIPKKTVIINHSSDLAQARDCMFGGN